MFEDPKDFPFTVETEEKLKKIDRNLEEVLREAKVITDLNFQVLEGKRSRKTQEMLWYKGESPGDHMSDYTIGMAVTLGIYIDKVLLFGWEPYTELARCISYASKNLDIPVGWSTVSTDLRKPEADDIGRLIQSACGSASGTQQYFHFIPQHFWVSSE
jgi:hypothetical protein